MNARPWSKRAACRGMDGFFGPDGERSAAQKEAREAAAKAVCARCPVREACLEYAVSRPEKSGLWGGLNEEELRSERRRRMRERLRVVA